MAQPDTDPVESAIGGIKSQAVQETLRAQASGASDDEKARILRLAQDIRDGQGGLGWPVLIIGAVLLAGLVWILSQATGSSPLTDVATGRPILMLIVITTTVVFGAMMLNAALYGQASDDAAQRFQRAREVFLVFSGICATVVGFYFGSATTAQAPSAVSLNASLGQDGIITATLAGGAPPYAVTLAQDGETVPFVAVKGDSSQFTLAVSKTVCPANGNYRVTGANGAAYPPVAVSFTTEQLVAAGWSAACGSGAGGEDAVEGTATEPAEETAGETPAATAAPAD
jgi:hypothetical protein